MKYFRQAPSNNISPYRGCTEDTSTIICQALETRVKKTDSVICHMQRKANNNTLLPSQIPSLAIVELIMNYGNLFTFHYYLAILNKYSEKRHLKRATNIRNDIHTINYSSISPRNRATVELCFERRRFLWHEQIKRGKLKGERCQRYPILNWLTGEQGTDDWRVEQDCHGNVVDQFLFLLKNLYATAPLAIEPHGFTRALPAPPTPS